MRAAELASKVQSLLSASLSNEAIRGELEKLAREPAFPGLTRIWGPVLYDRNRVLFRPFILSHFSPWALDPPRRFAHVPWKGEAGRALDPWLSQVDARDDVELFRKLYAWRISSSGNRWRPDAKRFCSDLIERFRSASSPGSRRLILSKFDLAASLDEDSACALYEIDAKAAKPFILKHLPFAWSWRGEKRQIWEKLSQMARAKKDEELSLTLFRRQAPLERWKKEVLALCDQVGDAEELVQALEGRHPEGFWMDLGDGFFELLRKRGRDVLPYLVKHMAQVSSLHVFRSGYDRMVALAKERQWFDLWATLLRVSAQPKTYNREVALLVADHTMSDPDVRQRLLMLAGVSCEWNFPGLGLARIPQLDEETAVNLYARFPDLLRGPFKQSVALTHGHGYPALIQRFLEAGDEDLVDYMASRAATRGGPFTDKKLMEVAETLAERYEKLRENPEAFAARACSVLGQIPAYSIWNYGAIVRENRLARLLFERSSTFYLADASGMRDLIEAPEIHVQALAYRALSVDDDRARSIASFSIDILLGTLLRPLHRVTRALAFGALANAAATPETARRILTRCREAMDLPDTHYPKEALIGLMGRLLHQWPELRSPSERPLVFEKEKV